MRNWSLLVLLSLATPFARADIVVTSTSPTLSGSGLVWICVNPEVMCTQLLTDSYDVPGGSASVAHDFRNITATSDAFQQVLATANHLGVEMGASVQIDGFGNHLFATAEAAAELLLAFDLTNAAVVDLTGSGNFLLSGPGFSTSSFGPVTLNAGSYALEALVETSLSTNSIREPITSFDHLNLSADFTPTQTPEPRWAFAVPIALLFILWRPLRAGRSIKVAE
jgi:hypothetical protein